MAQGGGGSFRTADRNESAEAASPERQLFCGVWRTRLLGAAVITGWTHPVMKTVLTRSFPCNRQVGLEPNDLVSSNLECDSNSTYFDLCWAHLA
jgi:hypothetical protein